MGADKFEYPYSLLVQIEDLRAENARLKERVAELEQWCSEDRPSPEDDEISAASPHPMRSGRHDLYAEAMRFVGAKQSKAALVDLVNWLLQQRAR